MIAARGVSVRRGGRMLIEDISVDLRPGEMLAVIGPNGAGKSTLLRALAGDIVPTEGHVTLDARELYRWKLADLARRRAVLPQATHVTFPMTAQDIVALGRSPYPGTKLRGEDGAAIRAATQRTGIQALLHRDYNTLSGGEQQRVQLTRVLAQIWRADSGGEPRFLLLDEPTASLDLAHQHALLAVVRSLVDEGVGVLAILHDLGQAAAYADRVLALKSGTVVALGTPEDVIAPEIVTATYGIACDVVSLADGRRTVMVRPASAPVA